MKLTRPSSLTLLTAALLVLLPALAVLQYRWVGQVSEAERDRMERNLRTAAFQFRGAFDGEIVRAVIGLRVDATTVRESAWYRYADRYVSWRDTADFPDIVANVFLVDEDRGQLRLRRWNTSSDTFDTLDWPDELASLRPRLEEERGGRSGRQMGGRPAVPESDSWVAMPLLNARPGPGEPRDQVGTFGFTVVQWDMAYIRSQVLPALDQRHFRNSDDRYRVAVVDADNTAKVLYESDRAAPVDPARADASEPLFGGFRDPLNNRPAPDRGDPRRDVNRFRERGDGPAIDGREPGPPGFGANGPGRPRFGRWVLMVQHESGSLEAAVERVRQRNLAISFSVLLLLTISVGVLTLSSQRAHRLARQQMEFVAGVSHELRTPVAVIRSAAENLSLGVVGSGDRVKQYGQAIETEARRLGDMVERVLQFAGIASGIATARVPLAPVEFIESAADAALHTAASTHIERHVPGDLPAVIGDPAALRSAVENLIANAVKYGGADKWVGIRAERGGTRRHPEVLITVADHGAGIPSDELPHIFNAFYRGANATGRQIQGSGLGLALVHQIVAAHGGRVTVSTRAGSGTAFTIHLPAVDPGEALINAPATQATEGTVHS